MSAAERSLLVLAIAAIVVAVVLVARYRPLARTRLLVDTGLASGVYLLTSPGCSSCDRARGVLQRRSVAFEELTWQTHPEVFSRLGIDAVPSVVVAEDSGSGRWWRGTVPGRLRALGPREIPRTGRRRG